MRVRRSQRLATASALAALSLALAAPAGAEPPPGISRSAGSTSAARHVGRQVFDLVLLRPLGLVQTAVGVALFPLFYPFGAVAGAGDDVIDACLEGPFEQTFRRPLGDF